MQDIFHRCVNYENSMRKKDKGIKGILSIGVQVWKRAIQTGNLNH